MRIIAQNDLVYKGTRIILGNEKRLINNFNIRENVAKSIENDTGCKNNLTNYGIYFRNNNRQIRKRKLA